MTTLPTTNRFHPLQRVRVCEDEVLGYVMSWRPNCIGTEYHVMYWQDCRRSDGWFPESDLEAA